MFRGLHPAPPAWERVHVRNDDSLVIEVRYGDVVVLLTGDIGAEIERTLVPRLSSAPVRILKVAHHGSHTSTSAEFLAAWRPQIAVISCGRGNRFGHPAPDVIGRLEAAGTYVIRTDSDGQITIETNGHEVWTRTYVDTLATNDSPRRSRRDSHEGHEDHEGEDVYGNRGVQYVARRDGSTPATNYWMRAAGASTPW